jgi:hypothetical protein
LVYSNSCEYTNDQTSTAQDECSGQKDLDINKNKIDFKRDLSDPLCRVYSKRGIDAIWIETLAQNKLDGKNPPKFTITLQAESY